MVDSVHFEVEGVERVIAALGALELGVGKIEETKGAQTIERAARREVPVLTGRLQGSIHAHRDGSITAGGPGIPYARVIHFGWRAHNIEPQPFLYHAAGESVGDVTSAFNADIKKVARGAGLNVL